MVWLTQSQHGAPSPRGTPVHYEHTVRSLRERALSAGATGYIGKFVTAELCAQGYDVTAFVRDKSGIGGRAGHPLSIWSADQCEVVSIW
jgi:hypothetical protein